MENVTGADFKSATADDNKKLFIETYGCQMNVADSEVIASVMQMAGYSVADTLEEADAVFMNTCSIRDNAEQKILNRLEFFHSLKKKKKNLIVLSFNSSANLSHLLTVLLAMHRSENTSLT